MCFVMPFFEPRTRTVQLRGPVGSTIQVAFGVVKESATLVTMGLLR
jgi:hypothetical protein